MSPVNAQELLREIETNVSSKDSIKAAIVLEFMPRIDQKSQEKILACISEGEPDFVFDLTRKLETEAPDFFNKFNEFGEMLSSMALRAPASLVAAIETAKDPSVMLIKTAGKAYLSEAVPVLERILEKTPDPRITRETLKSLGRIAEPGSANSISRFLYHANNKVVIESIKALAGIGTPTAMKRLSESLGKNHQTDILILDLFSRVQDNISLGKLNESLSSRYAHLRNYAKTKLISIGEKAVPLLTQNLMYDDPDLRIHSLNILGEIGDHSAYPSIRKLLSDHPADSNIRFAAYEALGRISINAGAHTLASGLNDPEEQVRLAAAAAIERNLNKMLASGISNMITLDRQARKNIVSAIINAQAQGSFFALIDEPDFQAEAIEYLKQQAPDDLRTFFHARLEKHGYPDLAEAIAGPVSTGQKLPLAVAVDDSGMIINFYKNVLHSLGFKPVLFQNPQKALKWLKEHQPAILFTDLNMPEMTGVELIQKTRSLYSSEKLPIIMITTQNEVQDNQDAVKAGVSAIGHKPFTRKSLNTIIEHHLPNSKQHPVRNQENS
ncbi:MAG: HEAT repeat domain-containing protein [Thermodesulfobacteriota bacterium]